VLSVRSATLNAGASVDEAGIAILKILLTIERTGPADAARPLYILIFGYTVI
jgi:hypothetical protein